MLVKAMPQWRGRVPRASRQCTGKMPVASYCTVHSIIRPAQSPARPTRYSTPSNCRIAWFTNGSLSGTTAEAEGS